MRQKGMFDEQLKHVGHYVVLSLITAFMLTTMSDAPFWAAFPITTVWMIMNGTLAPAPASTREDDDTTQK